MNSVHCSRESEDVSDQTDPNPEGTNYTFKFEHSMWGEANRIERATVRNENHIYIYNIYTYV